MIELIRTFRNQPLSRADYGPEAYAFYRTVARQVQSMGRGTLAISVTDEQAMIFVDSQLRGIGTVTLGDLIPGTYRVFVQVPGTQGRQYEIEVGADQDRALQIDWAIDSSIWVTENWIGLLFAIDTARAHEATYAGKVARQWGPDALVAVVGRIELQGGAGVIGTVYRSDGRTVRSAVVMDGEDNAAKLRSLARFLADGTQAAGLSVIDDARASPRALDARRDAPARPTRIMTRLVLAAGAGALVAGGALWAIDQDDTGETFTYRDTAPAGVTLGVAGLAGIGIGFWLWSRDRDARSAPTVSATSDGGSIGWAGSF